MCVCVVRVCAEVSHVWVNFAKRVYFFYQINTSCLLVLQQGLLLVPLTFLTKTEINPFFIKRSAFESSSIVSHIFSSERNENKTNERMKLVGHINVPMNENEPW